MSISNMLAPAGTDMAWLDLGEKTKLLHDRNSHSSLFLPIIAPQHVKSCLAWCLVYRASPRAVGRFLEPDINPRPSTHSAAQSSGAGAASAGVCHLCHHPWTSNNHLHRPDASTVRVVQPWCPRPGTPATGQVRRSLRCISEHTRPLVSVQRGNQKRLQACGGEKKESPMISSYPNCGTRHAAQHGWSLVPLINASASSQSSSCYRFWSKLNRNSVLRRPDSSVGRWLCTVQKDGRKDFVSLCVAEWLVVETKVHVRHRQAARGFYSV